MTFPETVTDSAARGPVISADSTASEPAVSSPCASTKSGAKNARSVSIARITYRAV